MEEKKRTKQIFSGWQCPICGCVFSPSVSICFFCPMIHERKKEIDNGKGEYCWGRSLFEVNRDCDPFV